MKQIISFLVILTGLNFVVIAQPGRLVALRPETKLPASLVDFDAYDSLTNEVKEYRKYRLIDLNKFLSWSRETNTVILDTRSDDMYKRKHVKGAIHLNFSDFTENNLRRLIPSKNTRILIYCNNNFSDDRIYFVTKSVRPDPPRTGKPITLALNIPTFINLYGYGYKNVYELGDLVSAFNGSILFEGTDVPRPTLRQTISAPTPAVTTSVQGR